MHTATPDKADAVLCNLCLVRAASAATAAETRACTPPDVQIQILCIPRIYSQTQLSFFLLFFLLCHYQLLFSTMLLSCALGFHAARHAPVCVCAYKRKINPIMFAKLVKSYFIIITPHTIHTLCRIIYVTTVTGDFLFEHFPRPKSTV